MCDTCVDNLDELITTVCDQHSGEDRLATLLDLRHQLQDAIVQTREELGEEVGDDEEDVDEHLLDDEEEDEA